MTPADLVADSEDEEYLSKDLLQPLKAVNPPRSDPLTKTTVMVNNAIASTSGGEARAEPGVVTKKPRPKPRRKPPTGSTDTAPFAPPLNPPATATPAPRNVATTVLLEHAIPTDSRPQDIPLTIADRAKSRVRNAKSKPVSIAQDIIEIPSDEDERLLRLSPHRPKQKGIYKTKTHPIPDLPLPSIHPSQESLVTPTSDFQPAPAISSQLPPSDPPSSILPLPTSTPESAKKRRQVAGGDDAEESPLNPLKKGKRRRVVMDDDDDNQTRVPPPQAIVTDNEPPPPNFFASSSSSLPPPPAPLVHRESRKGKLVDRNEPTDDALIPEAIRSDPPREKKTRPKPKKKSAAQPEPNKAGKSSSVSASTSRPRLNAKVPVYKSAEVIDDSDEESGSLVLPPPPRQLDSQSPLSDLSERSSRASKPVTPSVSRQRLVPEVVITTVPMKRTSSPPIQEVEEGRGLSDDGANGNPKRGKRQRKTVEEGYFDGLDGKAEVAPKSVPKGKGKAPPRGKSKTKPQPKEAMDDGEFENDCVDDAAGASKKAKNKAKAKATTKAKSTGSGKHRIADSDDEAPGDAAVKHSGAVLADNGDSPMAQKTVKRDEIPPPQDTREDQENTPPPPNSVKSKSNPGVTPSSVSRKTPPTSASSFTRLNYGHSLANEEKPMTMTEIIRKANSATGRPSGIKSHSSFMKGSRSALRKIAPLHARRKTPPPLPPKPPPPKKTKKQLELEEKWEEELEETIEGWAALSSQERELLRRQKRDMEMGYED